MLDDFEGCFLTSEQMQRRFYMFSIIQNARGKNPQETQYLQQSVIKQV